MENILSFFLNSSLRMAISGASVLLIVIISFYLFKKKKKFSSDLNPLSVATTAGTIYNEQIQMTQLDETMDSLNVNLMIKPINDNYIDRSSRKETTQDNTFSLPSFDKKMEPKRDEYKKYEGETNFFDSAKLISPLAVKPPIFESEKIIQDEFKNNELDLSQFEETVETKEIVSSLISMSEPIIQDDLESSELDLSQFEERVENKEIVSSLVSMPEPIIQGEFKSSELDLSQFEEIVELEEDFFAPVEVAASISESLPVEIIINEKKETLLENYEVSIENSLPISSVSIINSISENNVIEEKDYNDYILEALSFDIQNEKESATITMKEACASIKNIKILFYFKMAIQSYENSTSKNKLPEIIDQFYKMERKKRRQDGEVIDDHPIIFRKKEESIIFDKEEIYVEKEVIAIVAVVPAIIVINNDFDDFPPIKDFNDVGNN